MNIEEKTLKLWAQKLNCAECVFKLLSEIKGTELSPQLLKSAKIMGSGYKSGCICGAVNAAMVFCAIHMPKPNTELTQRIYSNFREKYGSSCCRVLRAGDEKQGIPKDKACPERVVYAIETALNELEKIE
ncbi:MAG: C-GCAxxG-C-C family (seleno)protein [Candidatus Diapherotrites archaeon]